MATSSLRVCIIASSLRIMGGQAVQAAELIKRFARDGIKIDFLPINPLLPGFLRWIQQVKYARTMVTWPVYVLSLLWTVPRVDVLHLFSASYFSFLLAPAPAAIIGKLLGKRVILNYHSGEAEDHLRRSLGTITGVLKFVDRVVVPSEYLQQVFRRFGIETDVIPNVVDTEMFRFRDRQIFQPRFLVARSLEPLYNIECVLKAFHLIQNRFPEAMLTVLGSGSQERKLKSLAETLGLQNVRFAGRVDRDAIPQYYAGHDIILNASNVDNMPLFILEAFAAGLPVISTDAGGIPLMIKDRGTGMLVRLNDHESLAKRAIELLEDQGLTKTIVRLAHDECASRYSWDMIGNKWLKTYKIL